MIEKCVIKEMENVEKHVHGKDHEIRKRLMRACIQ
jgi:hypothetical protein